MHQGSSTIIPVDSLSHPITNVANHIIQHYYHD